MKKFRLTASALKRSVVFLRFANWVLIAIGWVAALYAYPRLPRRMALWLNFLSRNVLQVDKSVLFFLYPLAQTLFFVGLSFFIQRLFLGKKMPKAKPASSEGSREERSLELDKEFLWLALIFVNLIFIHLQTSVILLSHGLASGINSYYFYAIFGILVMLIPYYKVRKKLYLKK